MHREYSGSENATWITIRDPLSHKILLKFDPVRELIEVAERGKVSLIDLNTERQLFFNRTPQSVPNA